MNKFVYNSLDMWLLIHIKNVAVPDKSVLLCSVRAGDFEHFGTGYYVVTHPPYTNFDSGLSNPRWS